MRSYRPHPPLASWHRQHPVSSLPWHAPRQAVKESCGPFDFPEARANGFWDQGGVGWGGVEWGGVVVGVEWDVVG